MSFLSELGKFIGQTTVHGMERSVQIYQEGKKSYDNAYSNASEMDDKNLINSYKNESNNLKKAAYAQELKNRGYGKKE